MGLWRLCLLCVSACLATGCAIDYQLREDLLPARAATALIEPWPLDIGLYIPPPVQARVIGHQAWRMPVGETLTANFHWTLRQMFRRVEVLTAPPAGRRQPGELSATLELAAVDYRYGVPGSLGYDIVLRSTQGAVLDAWSVTTPMNLWDLDASSLRGSLYSVSSEFALAMRNVTAQFMLGFAERPAVAAWLRAQGLAATLRPASRAASARPAGQARILLVPNIGSWLHTDAARARSCVGQRLETRTGTFEIVPVAEVRLGFFPWLEPGTAPKTTGDLLHWLATPPVRSRMQALGVRYLLEFHGGTTTEMPGGGIVCGGGYGAGGCLGFAWGSRQSAFRATLLDARADSPPLETGSSRRGGAYMPAFILPVPIMAATQRHACEDLRRRLRELLEQDTHRLAPLGN